MFACREVGEMSSAPCATAEQMSATTRHAAATMTAGTGQAAGARSRSPLRTMEAILRVGTSSRQLWVNDRHQDGSLIPHSKLYRSDRPADNAPLPTRGRNGSGNTRVVGPRSIRGNERGAMLSRLRSRYHAWFLVLMAVTLVVVVFVNWRLALYALGVVIVIGGIGQLAGLWHPVRKAEGPDEPPKRFLSRGRKGAFLALGC